MSQVLYRIHPGALRSLLEKVSADRDAILAWAPVDEDGTYIDDGTYVEDATILGEGEETQGIALKVVHLDVESLRCKESDLSHAILELLEEPAFTLAGGCYVTHCTVQRIAGIIDGLREIHARVSAVSPALDIAASQRLDGVIDGATALPVPAPHSGRQAPGPQLIYAMRRLAELNNASHRAQGHGKSWEPGFRIARLGEQWTITFHSYQFLDSFRDDGDEHGFRGTWDDVTDQILTATEQFARKYNVFYDEQGLDDDHPIGRLSHDELARLPDDVAILLQPGRASVVAGPQLGLLERVDVGIDGGALIELARYVVTESPDHLLIADAIEWNGDRFAPCSTQSDQ